MNSASSDPKRPLLPALFLALLSAMAVMLLLGLQPLRSTTYWWFVAIGEFITTWERVPNQQLFLFTVPYDEPWIYSNWLGSVILYFAHELGGAEFTLLVRNIVCALSASMVTFALARRYDRLAAVFIPTIIIGAASFFFVDVGAAMLAMPIATAGLLGVFFTLENPQRRRWALVLPASIVAVINIDFATAMVLVFVGLVVAVELLRRGARAQDKKVTTSGLLTATCIPAIFTFAYGATYLPAALGYVATTSVIATFSVLVALIAAHVFVDRGPAIPTPKILAIALVCITALAIILQPGIPTRQDLITTLHDDLRTEAPAPGTLTENLPLRCAEELRRTGRQLQIFNDREYAGFLLYHALPPDRPYSMLFDDHRKLLDDETLSLTELMRNERVARGLFSEYAINAAVFDRQANPILASELDDAPEWRDLTAHRDHDVACFYRAR